MASKSNDDVDPLIVPAQEFSSFLDSLVTEAGLSGSIQNIDEFKQVINTFIDMIKKNTNDLPEGITKTKLKTFFQKKQMQDGGNGINMLGGIIMANICRSKLMRLQESADNQAMSSLAGERINSFFNEGFVTRFSQAIPFRGNTGDAGSGVLRRGTQAQSSNDDEEDDDETSDGSYTKFYNELFNVTKKRFKWRSDIFAPVSNDLQCLRAMGDSSAASSVSDIHDSGTLKCYICGCQIKSLGGARGQDKMQCEHILPIITALAHWWLVKPQGRTPSNLIESGLYSPETSELLSNEYAWSHACCNLIKNNWEIIEIGAEGCQPYTRGISALLQAIWEGAHPPTQFDCGEVNSTTNNCLKKLSDKDWNSGFKASASAKKQKKAISDLLKPLTNRITMNIEATANWQLYQLLTKFKIIAAMTDDNFLSVLLDKKGSDLPEDALASAESRRIQDLKNLTNVAMSECNNNKLHAGKLESNLIVLNKQLEKLFKKEDALQEKINRLTSRQMGREKETLDSKIVNLHINQAEVKNLIEKDEESLELAKEVGPYKEYVMMMCLKDYLLGGGNEYLAEDEKTFLWLWSGSVGEYLTDESKESYIAELVAMDDPSQEESGIRKRQRVGGRSPLMSVNNDFIKSSELINPELLKGNIERKPLLQNEDNIKLEIKEKPGNKHYDITFTQNEIDNGKILKSQMTLGYNNANIFVQSIKDMSGPSIDIIKQEFVNLFTEDTIDVTQRKLQKPVDMNFINDNLSGGKKKSRKRRYKRKTRKSKRKNRKNTRKNIRRYSRKQ
tara:strand:+ start:1788 stop:4145 length:2358 start_codon:yes stop_codon:yes gene_type:complete